MYFKFNISNKATMNKNIGSRIKLIKKKTRGARLIETGWFILDYFRFFLTIATAKVTTTTATAIETSATLANSGTVGVEVAEEDDVGLAETDVLAESGMT